MRFICDRQSGDTNFITDVSKASLFIYIPVSINRMTCANVSQSILSGKIYHSIFV